ncbi:TetR/AcrR family transcriptional regulator [Paenibacillus macerans]|uniref:TetR/AcrR family transcriptional regulator n=1 Tax=Paenibacillus macerans TaxID=44252 RepID=UPI000EC9D23B|nr:TetR/AcrR family transcriptional regulator [Paenibacillus macerans]GBK64590.1 TetR/AcrR family transcriptional regulator [Paenibacillus macerans]GBK72028.1 TetR/AcrR family transcriptional regulator [Paenibacillus macerans]
MEKLNLRQQKGLETKNRLIDSALKVFSAKGFDASTTKDIAKEAGTTDGLIYHYFKSKEELLWAVVDKHSLIPDLRDTAAQADSDVPLESLLTKYFGQLLHRLNEKTDLIVMFFGEAQRKPQIREYLVSLIEEVLKPLYFLLKDRTAMDEEELRLAVRNIQTAMVMYFLLYDRFTRNAETREIYIRTTVQQFLKILG